MNKNSLLLVDNLNRSSIRSVRNAHKPNFFYYTAKPTTLSLREPFSDYPGNYHLSKSRLRAPTPNKNNEILNSPQFIRFEQISKVLVYVICMAVLSYYLFEFGQMYSSYPTVVDVDVKLPRSSELPGITICVRDPNQISKSETCKINQTICDLFEKDEEDDSTIETFFYNLTTEQIFGLSRMPDSFFKTCLLDGKNTSICNESFRLHVDAMNCYVLNQNWFNVSKPSFNLSRAANIDLNPRDSLKLPITVDVFVHDPLETADFRTYSFASKGGKQVEISLLQTTVKLLEPPYITKCKSYEKNLLDLGPLEEMKFDVRNYIKYQDVALGRSLCTLSCLSGKWMEKMDCIPLCVPFSSKVKKCLASKEIHELTCHGHEYNHLFTDQCENDECPVQCKIVFYDVQTNEDDILGMKIVNKTDSKNHTIIKITNTPDQKTKLQRNQLTKITMNLRPIRNILYQHNPKFSAVEAIGYVGGYVGIFLGLSIPVFYDYIVVVLTYVFRLKFIRKHFGVLICV